MVTSADIDPILELVDLMTASRSYEANAAVIRTSKDMALKALDIISK